MTTLSSQATQTTFKQLDGQYDYHRGLNKVFLMVLPSFRLATLIYQRPSRPAGLTGTLPDFPPPMLPRAQCRYRIGTCRVTTKS